MTQKPLTEKQQAFLDHLKQFPGVFVGPTKIGIALGRKEGEGTSPSAWASPTLKTLVERGLVERNDRGHYKAK